MAKRHYEESECVKALKRHPFTKIDTVQKIIYFSDEGVGINTWGKIDCLRHYHGYIAIKDANKVGVQSTYVYNNNGQENPKKNKVAINIKINVKNGKK